MLFIRRGVAATLADHCGGGQVPSSGAWTILLERVPRFSISHSITSPGTMKRGGSIAAPIPSGVPVRIIVPGTSLQKDTQCRLEPNTHNQPDTHNNPRTSEGKRREGKRRERKGHEEILCLTSSHRINQGVTRIRANFAMIFSRIYL